MLSIFVCDENPSHLARISKCISNYVMMENIAVRNQYFTDDLENMLRDIRNEKVYGLYFLDIDLKGGINGIQLAVKIREYDPRGFIVFVTVDADSYLFTLDYKVEAMDYIVKGDNDKMELRICECIHNANQKLIATSTPLHEKFVFKISTDRGNYEKNTMLSIRQEKIIYFATYTDIPHAIVLQSEDGWYIFRGKLSETLEKLDKGQFIKCHRSFIVNIKKITKIDKSSYKLWLENGESVRVAARKIKEVKQLMNAAST